MTDLVEKLVAVNRLPAEALGITDDEALAYYLSDFVLSFLPASTQAAEQGYHPRRRQPRFQLFLPFAVATDFPCCTPAQIRQVAICSSYGILYNGLIDVLFDIPDQTGADTLALAQHVFHLFHTNLNQLFPSDSPFWAHLQEMLNRFFQALREEQQNHKGALSPYPYQDFCRLAQGKMATALVNPVALALLDGTPERISLLCQSWDELNVAVVIMDDIKDWEEDLQQANYTFLLTQTLIANGAPPDTPPPIDEVAYLIAKSGIMEVLYELGANHLHRAAELAQTAEAPALAQLATIRAETFLKYRHQLIKKKAAVFVKHLKKRISLSVTTGG